MADTATFGAAMKTKFLGPIRDNIHRLRGKVLLFGGDDGQGSANPTDFPGIIRSAEGVDFVGNEFRIPLKASRNQAVGFRSENDTLPAPGASKYTYLQEPMRYAYGLFNITGQLLKASDTNEGAFKQAFKAEMEDLVLTAKIDHNRAAYGNGVGALATATAAVGAATNVIPVDTTIYFRGGEIIDFVTVSTGAYLDAAHAALEVTAINRAGLTITFGNVANLTANLGANTSIAVRASSDSTSTTPNNSFNREIQGLANIVAASGSLHGVSPTTYPFWASFVQNTVGAISDTVLRNAKDSVGFESGLDEVGGLEFVIVTTRGVRRRYSDTLTAQKRFAATERVTLKGGFDVLLFDENPIFVDDQCPIGNVFGLRTSKLFWAQMSDWEWMERDGDVLKWESRRDRYIAVLYKYSQLGTTHRNSHFRLTGVTDDTR